ncbi:hypothetical protein [Nocardia sp. XZ_19_231]|uniref:hypothetical protein n=1 Tax=Nocardia sp. XZ_19_231 TaxID=2769252 RepID=UPI00188E6335|nr:hypothetical protein [Nocardia sp. XZ_19_231]
MTMNEKQFDDLIRAAPIPYPWDPVEYVNRVAELRGRPIVLFPIDAQALAGTGCGTGSGLWIAREHDDVIMYGGETESHAYHIICHEIGHMLLGHDDVGADSVEADEALTLSDLMPSLSIESIRSVLRRQDYGTEREREAEMFAGLLMVHAMLPERKPSRLRSTFFRGGHR